MHMENDKIMFCKEGKCVDVKNTNCGIAFEDINNQLECELLQRLI